MQCGARHVVETRIHPSVLLHSRIRKLHDSLPRHQSPRLHLTGKVLPQLTRLTPGQIFVHQKFGYFGAVLSSWTCRCYEHHNGLSEASPRPEAGTQLSKQRMRLINTNPTPHCPTRTETDRPQQFHTVGVLPWNFHMIESRFRSDITYLEKKSAGLGMTSAADFKMDFVDHDDIIPIEHRRHRFSDHPVHKELLGSAFYSFLLLSVTSNGDNRVSYLKPSSTLHFWLADRERALSCREVHFEITSGFKVTVMPFYLGQEESGQHVWRYFFRIECLDASGVGTAGPVTLRERYLFIAQPTGTEEKICSSDQDMPTFQPCSSKPQLFTSSESLRHIYQSSGLVRAEVPGGLVSGWFRMEARDGVAFNCFLPQFSLNV